MTSYLIPNLPPSLFRNLTLFHQCDFLKRFCYSFWKSVVRFNGGLFSLAYILLIFWLVHFASSLTASFLKYCLYFKSFVRTLVLKSSPKSCLRAVGEIIRLESLSRHFQPPPLILHPIQPWRYLQLEPLPG